MNSKKVQCEFGSFRDPSGYVFYFQDEIYRALDSDSFTLLQQLDKDELLSRLEKLGYLIPTKIITQTDPVYSTLKENLPHENHFLHHAKVPIISYPYEWSFSMLADSAKLQLELQLTLIEKGYSLKDASAFNVQFISCQPVFIDILSIEKLRFKELWIAYGQFCQMYLFPLLLKRYRNISSQGYFLNNINGLSVEEVYYIFGPLASLRPALLIDVFLQYHFQKSAPGKNTALKQKLKKEGSDTTSQVINLKRLLSKITKISHAHKPISHWADYINENTYSIEAEEEKVNYIKEFLKKYSPQTVLDLGCNTGRYSLLASESGADVIAVDSDHDSIDLLYKHAKKAQANILPLWLDIANPTPALGFRNQERKSFMDRVQADTVFALALIHHLLITSRIPMDAICDLFYELTETYLVVEFIGRNDDMFQTLRALREDIYSEITSEAFIAIFNQKFELINQRKISNTERTLFTFKKK
jgi:SAM-dependent methyltransferase